MFQRQSVMFKEPKVHRFASTNTTIFVIEQWNAKNAKNYKIPKPTSELT